MTVPAFPLADYCGLSIETPESGRAVGTLTLDAERHANPNNVLHGGVVFVGVDTTMGAATLGVLPPGQVCATIEIQIRYLRAVTMDAGPVTISTRVVHPGRKVVHLESQVFDAAERLVAMATGSFAVIGMPA